MRDRSEGMAKREALYIMALPRAWQQNIGRQVAVIANAALLQPGRSPIAPGGGYARAERHGARSILSAPLGTVGKQKAVTATARKIAVLFYNTLRFGMTYNDPGAAAYDERHRTRVLANLHRRARSLGYILSPTPDAEPVS